MTNYHIECPYCNGNLGELSPASSDNDTDMYWCPYCEKWLEYYEVFEVENDDSIAQSDNSDIPNQSPIETDRPRN